MTVIALLLIAAAIAFGLSKLIRLPSIPLLMLCGAGLSALAEYRNIRIPETLHEEIIQIGLTVLVFTAGAELSPRRMRKRTQAIMILAFTQFFTLGACGILTALFLDYGWTNALYFGCAFSASSTLVAVRHLQQRRQMFESYGRLVLGVLLLQDVFIVWIMIALLKMPEGGRMVLNGLAHTIALGFPAIVFHRWVVPFLLRKLKPDDEELMLISLALLFAFSATAHLLELPFLVGGFFAGFAISAFPMNGLVRGMLGSLSGFFLALFFISVGSHLTMPDPAMLGHGLIFVAVLIVATVLQVAVIAQWLGYSSRVAMETGLLLSQTSEFSLMLALIGVSADRITAELFTMIALITMTTMALTPFIAKERVALYLVKWHPRYRKTQSMSKELQNHAVLLSSGSDDSWTIRALAERSTPFVVVDEDVGTIRQLTAKGIPCIQGDPSNIQTLKHARCRQAMMVICSMRRKEDAQLALEYLKDAPAEVLVYVFEAFEEKIVRKAGGIPISTACASAAQFMKWVDANLPPQKEKPGAAT